MYHATVWTFQPIPETTLLSTLNLRQISLSWGNLNCNTLQNS